MREEARGEEEGACDDDRRLLYNNGRRLKRDSFFGFGSSIELKCDIPAYDDVG